MDKITQNTIPEIPENHRNFILTSIKKLQEDKRLLGVAIGGSFLSGNMDKYSDLDFVVVVDKEKYQEVLNEKKEIVKRIGPLLSTFTGEHVGATNLLICLYGPPLLHVDFKFVSLADAKVRGVDPFIIWERDNLLTKNIFIGKPNLPSTDLDWIEDRFWTWVHYLATKIGRGEVFDVIDGLTIVRALALGNMIHAKYRKPPQGVRRIEEFGTQYVHKLKKTVPLYDRESCLAALKSTIGLYRDLRKELNQSRRVRNSKVEREAIKYMNGIQREIGKDRQ